MLIPDYGQKLFELFSFTEDQIDHVSAKILNGNVLTVTDKKMIYALLSGDTDPSPLFCKRGPKAIKYLKRNIEIAEKYEELEKLYKNTKNVTDELSKYLEEKRIALSPEGLRKALKNGQIGLAAKREKLKKRWERAERLRFRKLGE